MAFDQDRAQAPGRGVESDPRTGDPSTDDHQIHRSLTEAIQVAGPVKGVGVEHGGRDPSGSLGPAAASGRDRPDKWKPAADSSATQQ